MQFILKSLLNLQGAKLARQILAAGIGVATAHGYILDPSSVGSMITGLISIGLLVAWSAWHKAPADAEVKSTVSALATAAASQFIPILSGWLSQHGLADGTNATPEALLLWGANAALSHKNMPDKKPNTTPPTGSIASVAKKIPAALLLAGLSLSSLTACQSLRNARLVQLNNAAVRALLLAFLAIAVLPSCVYADSRGAGQWRVASVMTNAQEMNVTAEGFTAKGLDQGTAAKDVIGKVASLQIQKKVVDAAGSVINETVDSLAK